jgi:hypothetical protein
MPCPRSRLSSPTTAPAFRQPGDLRISRQHRLGAQALPAAVPARWKALTQEALADGILTPPNRAGASSPCRRTRGRKGYIALQQGKVTRAVAEFEKQAGSLGNLDTIGEITIGCALGYLDFRYANEPWRPGHPKLTAWYEKVVKLAPLAETIPVG